VADQNSAAVAVGQMMVMMIVAIKIPVMSRMPAAQRARCGA